jgi:hypothetical protein
MARKAQSTATQSPKRTKMKTPILKGSEGTRRIRRQKPEHTAEADLATAYGPDTQGGPLPEVDPRLTEEQHKAKDARYLARKFKAPPKQYAGPPIPATTVYIRPQPNRNTAADTWLVINEAAGTYTTVNTYRDVLPPSYQPSTYTYQLTATARRRIERKIAGGVREVDAPDWPAWITAAGQSPDAVPVVPAADKPRRKSLSAEATGGNRRLGRGRVSK